MKEAVSEDYCPTDKSPSASLPCMSSKVCKAHSLWSEFCHTSSFSMESVLQLCPNQAVLLENALLYTLGKNFDGRCFRVTYQKCFHLQSQGLGGKALVQLVVIGLWVIVEGISRLGRTRFFGKWGCGHIEICCCRCQEIRISSEVEEFVEGPSDCEVEEGCDTDVQSVEIATLLRHVLSADVN
jgi:hypothetical protein